MTRRHRRAALSGVVAVLAVGACASSPACGPFFPETILDEPKAALRPPLVSFEAEVRQLQAPAAAAPPAVANPTAKLSVERSSSYRSLNEEILEPETRELTEILDGSPAQRGKLVQDYGALRAAMLVKYWSEHFSGYDLAVPPDGYALLAQAQLGHWPEGLPQDIALYLEGGLLYDYGDRKGALETWKRLLALPPDQRRNRSVAAAWMIAKTIRESEGLAAAQTWYAMCARLSVEGFRDCLGLGLETVGWQARHALEQGDRRRALELYYHQAMAGDPHGWNSLARAMPPIYELSDSELQAWATDPFLRGLLTATLLSASSTWSGDIHPSPPDQDVWGRWLTALERANVNDMSEAAKLAELAYSSGHFEEARRWLQRAPADDSRALWVRGKLALMDGDTKLAEKSLLAARPGFPLAQGSRGTSIYMDSLFLPSRTAAEYRTSQFYGDLGATCLARDHYTDALGALLTGGFNDDASYVAERVMTPDELVSYVRGHFDIPTGKYLQPYRTEEKIDPVAYMLRYLLARKLARARDFKAAREFYPDEIVPVFDRYVALMRKARSAGPRDERAAAYWEAAQIHRALGMELFGTEVEPDALDRWGDFTAPQFIRRRLGLSFEQPPLAWWKENVRPPDIVPPPTSGERTRVKMGRLPHEERFQYRYAAADLAWKAASLMPNGSEETARVLGIAGTWLKNWDPKSADRFYKAMIWRNWSTPLAREADERRWFPLIAWDYNPWSAAGVPQPEGY